MSLATSEAFREKVTQSKASSSLFSVSRIRVEGGGGGTLAVVPGGMVPLILQSLTATCGGDDHCSRRFSWLLDRAVAVAVPSFKREVDLLDDSDIVGAGAGSTAAKEEQVKIARRTAKSENVHVFILVDPPPMNHGGAKKEQHQPQPPRHVMQQASPPASAPPPMMTAALPPSAGGDNSLAVSGPSHSSGNISSFVPTAASNEASSKAAGQQQNQRVLVGSGSFVDFGTFPLRAVQGLAAPNKTTTLVISPPASHLCFQTGEDDEVATLRVNQEEGFSSAPFLFLQLSLIGTNIANQRAAAAEAKMMMMNQQQQPQGPQQQRRAREEDVRELMANAEAGGGDPVASTDVVPHHQFGGRRAAFAGSGRPPLAGGGAHQQNNTKPAPTRPRAAVGTMKQQGFRFSPVTHGSSDDDD